MGCVANDIDQRLVRVCATSLKAMHAIFHHDDRTVDNCAEVIAYWLIGREVVVALQGGEDRAEYGERLLGELSEQLTKRFGRGFSATNLRYFRLFYLAFSDRTPEIHHSTSDELGASAQEAVLDDLTTALDKTHRRKGFSPDLSWTHYRALTKIDDASERLFYEIETEKSGWSVATLERQIHSLLFARLLKSRDKAGILASSDSRRRGVWRSGKRVAVSTSPCPVLS